MHHTLVPVLIHEDNNCKCNAVTTFLITDPWIQVEFTCSLLSLMRSMITEAGLKWCYIGMLNVDVLDQGNLSIHVNSMNFLRFVEPI